MSELGPWLVRAREARGLTLEDAERDTRISRRYLQALESEEFDVIPAPVYARGFLRSYSQYLGLDPQEAMARYPRDEDAGYTSSPSPQSRNEPAAGSAPSGRAHPGPFTAAPPPSTGNRPTWRRPAPAEEGQPQERRPLQAVGGPARPQKRAASPSPAPGGDQPYEPTIGIDIGVPVPARRIQPDPAAQTRTMVVAVVAIVAIALVLFVALIISRLGGGSTSDSPGITDPASVTDQTPEPAATNDDSVAPSGLATTPGVVPDVEGQPQEVAIAAIREAGFEPNITSSPDDAPAGTVLTQSPGPGVEQAAGSKVTIVVSEGPN